MEQLIVVFAQKRNIGLTAIPYLAVIGDNKPIELLEHATPEHIRKDERRFTNDEKELINILSQISDQQLYRKFGREDSLRLFIDGLPGHKLLHSHILPFIDSVLFQAIKVLASSDVNAYYKDAAFGNLYNTDILNIPPLPAKALFYFMLKPEGLSYSLRILQEIPGQQAKEFSLKDREIGFICKRNAVIRIGNRIYYFDDIDHNKLKPFLDKYTIQVPSSRLDDYMKGFVANCIRTYEVIAEGFTIEKSNDQPSPHLSLLKDLNLEPVVGLNFRYFNRVFLADNKAPVFVDCIYKDGKYRFFRIRRDFGFEQAAVEKLHNLGLRRCGDALFKPVLEDEETGDARALARLAEWLRTNREKLEKEGFSINTEFEDRQIALDLPGLDIKSQEDNDWFDIHVSVRIGDFIIPFLKFRKNLIEGDPAYILPDGRLFLLPPEWFTRFSELFDYAKVEKDSIKLPRAHFSIMERVSSVNVNGHKSGENVVPVFPETSLPVGLNATLRPYQLEGYAWLNFLRENGYGGILADDMGLGKTLQTITMLLRIYQDDSGSVKRNEGSLPPSLIVMPTSLVHNWQAEFKKFAPALKIYNFTGGNRLRSKSIGRIFNHYHVVLTSYGILRNDIELLKHCSFHYFILDESQYVKNPSSKIYDAVKQVESRYRLSLTGTPIENSLTDLWAQMNLVNKGLLGSLAFFKRSFVQPITRQSDEEKELKLKKLIQPFLLRRRKEEVARDLPPLMEQTLYCDMTADQKSYYEKEKSGIRNTISKIFEAKDADQTKLLALQALTRLRQIANHPLMVDETYVGSSGKFEQIVDNLESIVSEGHNVLVFSSFVKDLEILERALKDRKLAYSMLTGATQERQKVIEEFNEKAPIFLISLKAGGVGLNLVKADYVFMLNPWWNPAAEAQAINRAHRIGQTRNVFVYRFISSDTIEEKIAKLQQRKTELADMFVNSNNPLSDLSKEEIMELLS